ncbi:MAG: hypothetical protein FWH03_01120 [Firmicutes bacterium]|nr:hypothetical protein [Bacillota bacterium]
MSDFKQKQLERERFKALCDLLVAECKSKHANLDSVKTLLQSGADVQYKYSEPLRRAAKNQNFELIKLLINHGALTDAPIARTFLAQICDHKFNEKIEPAFFEILDMAHSKTGDYMSLFTPYINSMAVHGRLDKLRCLQKRYYLTESELAGVIERRVIFEIVLNNHDEILEFIEKHKNWYVQESYDMAVDSGEWIVLERLIKVGGYVKPSDKAVAKAVFDGHFAVLDMLFNCGYSFERKEIFLEKACRAALSRGTRSLAYLTQHGYALSDKYMGKTILEHAIDDKNLPLLDYLQSNAG